MLVLILYASQKSQYQLITLGQSSTNWPSVGMIDYGSQLFPNSPPKGSPSTMGVVVQAPLGEAGWGNVVLNAKSQP